MPVSRYPTEMIKMANGWSYECATLKRHNICDGNLKSYYPPQKCHCPCHNQEAAKGDKSLNKKGDNK